MTPQNFANHAHRPLPTAIGGLCLLIALVAFGLRWFEIGGRLSFAVGIAGLAAAVGVLLALSRLYITALQDRIIRVEMRLRGAEILTPEQQRTLMGLGLKQIAALRFAPDEELPALVERTARERLPPGDIKRALRGWVPDTDRT